MLEVTVKFTSSVPSIEIVVPSRVKAAELRSIAPLVVKSISPDPPAIAIAVPVRVLSVITRLPIVKSVVASIVVPVIT